MIYTPPPKQKIVLFQPNKLDAFFQNQRKKVLRSCIKLLSKRGKYPNFWVMFNDDICKQMLLNGFYERELLEGMECLAKNKGGIAIDVGANIGNHTVYFSQHFSQVISFEPVPENCGVIRANLYLNGIKNVTLIEKGLGAEAAIIDLGNDDPTNTNNGFALSKSEQTIHSPGKRQATVVRGDDELQGIEFANGISMIKIDVEGMEPQVIKGLTKTIQKYRPLIFWEAFTHDTANASVEILREMGYENFYHMTTRRTKNDLINKISNSFGKSTYLAPLSECDKLDGMNVAMMSPAL
jgi:FkbM family methyltransferase